MREVVEFRIPEDNASQYLDPGVGVRVGLACRKVTVPVTDPIFLRIRQLSDEFRTRGASFFFGWRIFRSYTKQELDSSDALLLRPKHVFEPAGEECGTIYVESTACEFCGVGATRTTNLILDGRQMPDPGKLAIAQTIAGEPVVSSRFVELFEMHNLRGADFEPILDRRNPGDSIPDWFELVFTHARFVVIPPTQAGNDIFDLDSGADTALLSDDISHILGTNMSWCDRHGKYKCPRGHTIGLNLISELTVEGTTDDEWDIARTEQYVGVRRGLLRPTSLLVISRRLGKLIQHQRMRGMETEVVHIR